MPFFIDKQLPLEKLYNSDAFKWPAALKDLVKDCLNFDAEKRPRLSEVRLRLTLIRQSFEKSSGGKSGADVVGVNGVEASSSFMSVDSAALSENSSGRV